MTTGKFNEFFRSHDTKRDNFLARLFGLFSEETIRIWCQDSNAPYEDLGRPTLYKLGESSRGRTLDFTLRSRSDGRIFVAEMKCELTFENYRSMTLVDHSQLERHSAGRAFNMFLDLASNPATYRVKVRGKPVTVSGAILAWGSVSSQGRKDVMAKTAIEDILSVEEAISTLTRDQNAEYLEFVRERRRWCGEIFDYFDPAAP